MFSQSKPKLDVDFLCRSKVAACDVLLGDQNEALNICEAELFFDLLPIAAKDKAIGGFDHFMLAMLVQNNAHMARH